MDPDELRAIIRDELRPLLEAAQHAAAPTQAEDMLTAPELAAALRCSVDQVYQMARAGDIPGIRLGRSWRFILADVSTALTPKPVDLWASRSRKKTRSLS